MNRNRNRKSRAASQTNQKVIHNNYLVLNYTNTVVLNNIIFSGAVNELPQHGAVRASVRDKAIVPYKEQAHRTKKRK